MDLTEKYPALTNVIGYLHQDWKDDYDWKDREIHYHPVIRFFKTHNPIDWVKQSNQELRNFIDLNLDEELIRNCSFENANVSGADFSYTYLVDVDVKGTKIDDAHFSDARELPEEWKQTIGWYSEEQQNIRRIKEMLREEGLR